MSLLRNGLGMYHRVASIGLICMASAATAEPTPIAGKGISDLVSGATVQLDTPLGTRLPVKYAPNGLISGEAGGLAWFLGSSADRGRWWVVDDRLCHKWFKWFDAEVQCLRLKREGQMLHWSRDDGKTGTATLVAAEPIAPAPYALGNPEAVITQATDAPVSPAMQPAVQARAVAQSTPQAAAPAPVVKTQPQPKLVAKQPATAAAQKTVSAQAKIAQATIPAATTPAAPATPAKMMTAQVSPAVAQAAPAARHSLLRPGRVETLSFRVAGVQVNDVLNVRQGPSSEAPAVGAIPPHGQGVRMLGRCQLDWCPVTHRGLSGWVNRAYLVEEN